MSSRSSDGSSGAAAAIEVAAVCLVLVYGMLLVHLVPEAAYVPVNLAFACTAVLTVRGLGVGWRDLGLARDRMAAGLRLGALWLLPIVAGVAVVVAIPATRSWFLDDTVLKAGTGESLYRLLLRIPFGTALAEELIFRGALLGLFLKHHRPWVAVALSAIAFGLWHVVSTLGRIDLNQAAAGAGAWERVGIVASAVLFTAAAGLWFGWLRLHSGSLLAPWLAHAGTNTLAFGAAKIAGRL